MDGGSPPATVELDGRSVTLADVGLVARDPTARVRVSEEALASVRDSRTFVEELLTGGQRIYGVTTGFGRLASVQISGEQQAQLQRNLIRSHSAGVGKALGRAEVRAMMALRANALARGNSGCREKVVQRLVEYLNHGIHPRVPEVGSVGASGDLAPLAHVALALIGEGRVEYRGSETDAADVLAALGLEPLELKEKEGLALINGTQCTTALGALAVLAAGAAIETAEVAGAMSLDGLRGTPEAFRPEVMEARPHAGQRRSGRRLTELLAGSEIRESHRNDDPRLQDAYSLRCMPQVHGAARDALAYVHGVVETEVNSATDNPLVFPEAGAVVSAGNFHAQVVAQALDFLALVLADLAAISERRIERLLNPDLSGLPAFLAAEPGLQSGLMIAQVTAVDLLSEMRVLAHPASADSVPTSANQEDHVSMGLTTARKLRRSVECLQYVLAIELIAAARALDILAPLRTSPLLSIAHQRVRETVPPTEGDRPWGDDVERLRERVADGSFADLDGARGAL